MNERIWKPADYCRRIERGDHQLVSLPYSYDALEPVISAELLYIHHRIHHASYVEDLNEAELALVRARRKDDYEIVRHWSRELAFNGSGDMLHVLYWYNMRPDGGDEPPPDLAEQLWHDYGSVATFMKHFIRASEDIAGNGWGVLVWQPMYGRTEILTAERHENMTLWGTVPLLVVDVWEHPYYLDYDADRQAYLQALWDIVDWQESAQRLRWAKKYYLLRRSRIFGCALTVRFI